MVRLELVAKAAQDHDGLLDRWFRHQHRLEAPLERRIFFDVLLIFVEGCRADQAELATGKRGFQHVRDIEAAFATALSRPHNRVQFIDKQDQFVLLGRDFIDQLLGPLFEFAAILRSSHHRVDVHLDEPLAAQHFRDVAVDDALGQPFDDRGLAHTRFADQHRIVLLAPREHFDRALDFLRATQHRVKLALTRHGREVASELVKVGRAGWRVDTAVLRTFTHDFHDLLTQRFWRHTIFLQQRARDTVRHGRKPDQQMLRANIRVPEIARRLERKLERLFQTRRDGHLVHRRVGIGGSLLRMLIDIPLDVLRRELELLEQCRAHVGVREHVQQVFGVEFAAAKLMCLLRGALQQFERLLTESIGRIDRFTRHLGGEPSIFVLVPLLHAAAEEARQAASPEQ